SVRKSGVVSGKRVRLLFVVGDMILLSLSIAIALLIRFEGAVPAQEVANFPFYVLVSLIIKLPLFTWFGLYRMSWAHVSLGDLTSVGKAVAFSSGIMGGWYFILR